MARANNWAHRSMNEICMGHQGFAKLLEFMKNIAKISHLTISKLGFLFDHELDEL